MKIKIFKKHSKNQIVCIRDNGIIEINFLGPNLPLHDISHYVIEKELNLRNGFFGNINNGFTIKQLSDKEIIRTLPIESSVSEIITRALQALYTGACTKEQFNEIIMEEFAIWNINYPHRIDREQIHRMIKTYSSLINDWNRLEENSFLELTLDFEK